MRRRLLSGLQRILDGLYAHRLPAVQQQPQRLFNSALRLLRRQMQDLQIRLVCLRQRLLLQRVIGHAESAAGEHVFTVTVVLERSRLWDGSESVADYAKRVKMP